MANNPFSKVATFGESGAKSTVNPFKGIATFNQEDTGGAMPFVNRAISSTLGAPVDLISGGFNLIPGVDIQEPIGGRKSIEDLFRFTGIQLPEEGQQPKSISEYIGRSVGEVAALTVPFGKTAQALSKGKGLVGRISSDLYKSMIKHPALTMTGEISGGTGAGAGRGVGEQSFPDSPASQSTAEMVGGVVGGIIPTVAANTTTGIAIRGGKRLLRRLSMPFTKKGAEYRAGKFIKEQVVDPEATIAAIGEETIGDLPPAIQAGEKRLTALYKNLIEKDPITEADTIERLGRTITKLEGKMREFGYGSPELLEDITRQRISAIELKIDRRIVTAMGKAQKKLDALPVANRRVHESRIVRSEIEKVRGVEKKIERELWGEVPKDTEVGFENTRKTLQTIKDDLSFSQQGDIPAQLKTDPIITGEKLESTNLREMQGLRSKLLEVARISREAGKWNKARIASDVADAILEDVGVVAGQATTPESKALQVAIASTKKNKERFEQGIVGKMLGYSRQGAPSIDPDLTLDISIGRMAQKGSVDINKIAITPEAVAATERYIGRSYVDSAVNKTTGLIDPVKSETWIRNNEAILDKFPTLRNQLTDASSSQEFANKTSTVMEARRKAIQDPNISEASKFLKSADLAKEIEYVFKSSNPKMAAELVRQARKDKTGKAFSGLRAGVIDFILDKSTVGAFNEVGEKTLSGKTLLGFIRKNDSVFKKMFNSDELSRMSKIGKELARLEAFETAKPGKDIELKDFASSALRLFARISGARIGGIMGRESAGGSLQMAQIFSGRFKDLMTKITKDKALQLIHDAVLSKDPSLLKALLLPIDKPTSTMGLKNLIVVNKRMNLWLAGTGKRVMEDLPAYKEIPQISPF